MYKDNVNRSSGMGKNHINMSPKEFEKYTLSFLEKQFTKDIKNCIFKHNAIEEERDGSFQIDGEIKFSVGGINMLVLIECKYHTYPIERRDIQVLYDNIRAVDAQKGIFISTSRYQSGAIKYAKEHGIALLSVVNGELFYYTRSKELPGEKKTIPPWVDIKPHYMVMTTQLSDTKSSFSIIDETDELLRFINDGVDGGRV